MFRIRRFVLCLGILVFLSYTYVLQKHIQAIKFTMDTQIPQSRDILPTVEPSNFQQNNDNDGRPSPVVIVTYSRSGSSFLGNILRVEEHEVFYIYEPLKFIEKGYESLHFIDGKKESFDSAQTAKEFVLKNLLVCDIIQLPLEFWDGKFTTPDRQGNQTCRFYKQFKTRNVSSDLSRFKTEINKLQAECLTSKAVIVKTIRYHLSEMNKKILDIKNLKIIYLVRDPRPTIYSKIKTLKNSVINYNRARSFCSWLYKDITSYVRFYDIYPEKLTFLLYEHLVTTLLRTTKRLYSFLNLTFTKNAEKSLFEMTTVDQSKRLFSTKRSNSKELAFNWRLTIPYDLVKEVDEKCSNSFELLGYKWVSSETNLRNVSTALFEINWSVSTLKMIYKGRKFYDI